MWCQSLALRIGSISCLVFNRIQEPRYCLSESSSKPRASYLQAAENDSELIGRRSEMVKYYLQDVRKLAQRQTSKYATVKSSIRVAQWNLNVLHGADFKSPVSAIDAAVIVDSLQADIVLIQEAGEQNFIKKNPQYPDSSSRILQFHDELKRRGYELVFADGVPNPAMLATKLKIVKVFDCFSIDCGGRNSHPHYDTMMKDEYDFETRSARFVQLEFDLKLGEASKAYSKPNIAVCITHLHHREDGLPGVRLGEIRTILERRPLAPEFTILATDFNWARRKDYNVREWAIISAGLDKVKQPHNDGVAEELESHGFVSTYDRMPGPHPKLMFTHWTSTIVDFAYVHAKNPLSWQVISVQVVPSPLSDHLPIIHDIEVDLEKL